MKAKFHSFLTLLAKWEALKLAFAIGAVAGMIFMAFLLTVPGAIAAVSL